MYYFWFRILLISVAILLVFVKKSFFFFFLVQGYKVVVDSVSVSFFEVRVLMALNLIMICCVHLIFVMLFLKKNFL